MRFILDVPFGNSNPSLHKVCKRGVRNLRESIPEG
jgi:hypothetical protein